MLRRRLGLLPVIALLACNRGKEDTAEELPPEICNDPTEIPEGAFFTDATASAGLSEARGTRLTTVDFDGDGDPDLLATRGSQYDTGDQQYVFLLRNDRDQGFVDVTSSSGLDHRFQTAAWGDVDNDGDLDLFTGSWLDRRQGDDNDSPHRLMLNDGTGHFTAAPDSELTFESALQGAAFVDYDRDGNLDLFLANWYYEYGYLFGEQDRLLKGQGDGTFVDVTEAAGLELIDSSTIADFNEGRTHSPSIGPTACDVDDDGDADLLVANYGRQFNHHWRNDGGTFTAIGQESGYAGDDNLDYSDNQFYLCHCESNSCDPDPGSAAINCSGDYWSEGMDDQPFRLNGNSFTTACGDVDNDGDMDLITSEIVHWHIGNSSDPTQLLLNDGSGTFTRPGNDVTGLERTRSGAWNEGDLQVSFLDLDNDGRLDILVNDSDYDGTRARLFRQTGDVVFEDVALAAGIEHERALGAAIADFDLDGDQDIVLGASLMRESPWDTEELHLFQNDLPAGNSARLRFEGTDANRAGIGARVTVEAGGETRTFEVSGGYGNNGVHHTTGLHVGLGDACTIDRITVRWPDAAGTTDVFEGVLANYGVTLRQGGTLSYDVD